MRHLKAGNRLGVTTSHRRAMMRNMVTSILEHGQITCTLARAKEVRKPLEKMISWGKQGDLNARRQALRFVKSKEAMSQLFENLAERYKDRQGGYSRIIKLGKNRLGDNSEMAIVQLLGSEADQLSSLKSKSSKKNQPKKKDSTVLKEVSEEVQNEAATAEIAETEIPLEKAETSQEKSTGKVEEPKLNTEVETAPAENVAQEKTETVELKAEVVPTETEVVPEEVKAETKSYAESVQNETEPASEKTVTEETASVKKTD
ncbi:MAG: 50S ribosomal protein L17 [Deltaproteobacteria bacterium]|jgi:large subunit ribosomal protein L17|nr:50S ribosomal protein L17 [Deltaproteobacteria bacterium]